MLIPKRIQPFRYKQDQINQHTYLNVMRKITKKREEHSCINQKEHKTKIDNYLHRLKQVQGLASMIQKNP